MCIYILIHVADPQSTPVVITIFALVVCTSIHPYVRPSIRQSQLFKISQYKTDVAPGGTVGLAEWIIDDTHVL